MPVMEVLVSGCRGCRGCRSAVPAVPFEAQAAVGAGAPRADQPRALGAGRWLHAEDEQLSAHRSPASPPSRPSPRLRPSPVPRRQRPGGAKLCRGGQEEPAPPGLPPLTLCLCALLEQEVRTRRCCRCPAAAAAGIGEGVQPGAPLRPQPKTWGEECGVGRCWARPGGLGPQGAALESDGPGKASGGSSGSAGGWSGLCWVLLLTRTGRRIGYRGLL